MITYKGKIYKNFTAGQLEKIERDYPDINTSILAEKTGLNLQLIYWAANRMGIKKSKAYISSMASEKFRKHGFITRFRKGQTPWNKGIKGITTGGEITQYKPGHLPHNTKYDGCISLRKDKNGHQYQYIRVKKAKWELLHRHIWRQHNGDIPSDCNVQFKDQNPMNCDIDNLYIISRNKQIDNNTIHRYPPELKQSIRLINKIKKLTDDKENRTRRAECAVV